MCIDTKILARELLAKKILNKPTFTIKDLFCIRDCLLILKSYNLADLDLLEEVNKYIMQKAKE